ncbi:MAG: GNAT family N-acetyltransferase [Sedimentisphaerales bacterium]
MLNGLSVRIGQDKDAVALVKFNMALAWETEHKQLSLPLVSKAVRTLLKNPQYGFYVVAEKSSEVIGSCMVTFEWSDWRCGLLWWIQSVYVKPEFRQRGVFKRLYEYLKDKASHQSNVCGFRLYVEQSNHTAVSTYEKVGMKKTSYKVYEELFGK